MDIYITGKLDEKDAACDVIEFLGTSYVFWMEEDTGPQGIQLRMRLRDMHPRVTVPESADSLREQLAFATAALRQKLSPTESCIEERAKGSGGCGACALCCKEANERADQSESLIASYDVAVARMHGEIQLLRQVLARFVSSEDFRSIDAAVSGIKLEQY